MFGPPWSRKPFDPPNFNTYLSHRSQSRRSYPGHFPEPPSRSVPVPPIPYVPHHRAFQPSYPKMPERHKLPKQSVRFSDFELPTSPDLSSSEWDDTYALDTDSDLDRIPGFPSRRRYASQDSSSRPELERVSVQLPRATAGELRLRSDEVLILPPLVHLHIRIRFPGAKEELRAAVPGSMAFEDVTKQVVQCYAGTAVPYKARVEQRGKLRELPRDTILEDLAHRGEAYRHGRREIKVEIVVGGDEVWYGGRGRFGQRLRGGGADAEVETIRKREVSRTRYSRART